MDKTLRYLQETLSNYLDKHNISEQIYEKLLAKTYRSEGDFVKELNEEEISFLDEVLPDEIIYALDEQDFKRVEQLNEVYELLY
ncbi:MULTISPECIES: sigma-G-dependent sporulation-specific acid-soluble spore protein CsgA [Bacillaceae]|uniref:sigma-G-dependent sporulation-specific acid-soluble spore protein CsgA n=1 Tax=Bacillaceae TaxID=186817 RepID=UPI001BDEA8A3|nr:MULTISPECIES: sigma-G-dependent sporulation-specific acid-soluble spore protein CsgA [Bacillaceae]MDX8362908.1 sigma-G-dependent sporulation-specific acid-soluble spore protein CsgA [Cytobacillus sp. IB215316]MDX8366488.1 sigma-G-dependent sporulation-specific acid-soluble spore protein CsgA [Cytobacillus sp. IB215665]